jgi:hypothetical protein
MPIEPTSPRCADCSGCDAGGDRPNETVTEENTTPWAAVVAPLFVFLVPVALGVAGATLAGDDANRQLLGAIFGLGVGTGCSVGIVKLLRRLGRL